VSTFTANRATLPTGYDIPSDVAQVVEASRHLCAHRAGLAEGLHMVAEQSVSRMPDEGARMLEPFLRGLGAEKADDWARQLYVAACHVVGHWDPDHDTDKAELELERLTHKAAHAVADTLGACTRICCDATKETHR
jgi:hypothetical protein